MDTLMYKLGILKDYISNSRLEYGEKAYLVENSFVKELERCIEKQTSLRSVNNKKIVSYLKAKKEITREDYVPVDYKCWDYIIDNFGGGPEVIRPVLENGDIELYPATIQVRRGTTTLNYSFSRCAPYKDFLRSLANNLLIGASLLPPIHFQSTKKAVVDKGSVGNTLTDGFFLYIEQQELSTVQKSAPARKTRKQRLANASHAKTPEVEAEQTSTNSPPGLQNLGNTCYMNSSLQCLLSVQGFEQAMKFCADYSEEPAVAKSMLELIKMTRTQKSYIDPASFKKTVSHFMPMFAGYDQHDSHEFVTMFIDALNERVSDKNGELFDLFYGKLHVDTICALCRHQSRVTERFSSLALALESTAGFVYAPYDLSQSLKKVTTPSSLAVKINGDVVSLCEEGESGRHHYVFETPAEGTGSYVILKLVTNKDRKICYPILMQAPSSRNPTQAEYEEAIWDRLSVLWSGSGQKNARGSMKVHKIGQLTFIGQPSVANKVVTVVFNESVCGRKRGMTGLYTSLDQGDLEVQTLVDSYFQPTKLDEENKWTCPKCKRASCASRITQIDSCPKTLILQLKRFSTGTTLKKDMTSVMISDQIEIRNNLHNYGVSYELRAVSYHHGTPDYGHYTADCKYGDTWYHFDDTHVNTTDNVSSLSSDAYVLFYHRI